MAKHDELKPGNLPKATPIEELQARYTIEVLSRIAAEERAHPIEAYMFLFKALEYTQRRLFGRPRHISGLQLLEGVRDLAIDEFGPLALMVLRHWGIRTTDDVGQMVFHLVDRGLLGKTEDDRIEDFHAVFDLDAVLAPEVLVARIDPHAIRHGYRLGKQRSGLARDHAGTAGD